MRPRAGWSNAGRRLKQKLANRCGCLQARRQLRGTVVFLTSTVLAFFATSKFSKSLSFIFQLKSESIAFKHSPFQIYILCRDATGASQPCVTLSIPRGVLEITTFLGRGQKSVWAGVSWRESK